MTRCRSGYPRAVPELPEVEAYRRLAEEALDRPIAAVGRPDAASSGRGRPPALRRVLDRAPFTAARRIGKLLLLDVDAGPDLSVSGSG